MWEAKSGEKRGVSYFVEKTNVVEKNKILFRRKSKLCNPFQVGGGRVMHGKVPPSQKRNKMLNLNKVTTAQT